jgi:hypothetical protein
LPFRSPYWALAFLALTNNNTLNIFTILELLCWFGLVWNAMLWTTRIRKSCRWNNQNGFDSSQPCSFAPHFDDNDRYGVWYVPIALRAGAEWKTDWLVIISGLISSYSHADYCSFMIMENWFINLKERKQILTRPDYEPQVLSEDAYNDDNKVVATLCKKPVH